MYNALRYIGLTLQHKWFVLVAGLRLGVPIWQLIIHDWSKLLLSRAYGDFFFEQKNRDGFERAWLYHQNHEPHHWEYWISRTSHSRASSQVGSLPMPEKYIREMVADWMAATRTYTGAWPKDLEGWGWFQKNISRIITSMHPESAEMLTRILRDVWPRGEF